METKRLMSQKSQRILQSPVREQSYYEKKSERKTIGCFMEYSDQFAQFELSVTYRGSLRHKERFYFFSFSNSSEKKCGSTELWRILDISR